MHCRATVVCTLKPIELFNRDISTTTRLHLCINSSTIFQQNFGNVGLVCVASNKTCCSVIKRNHIHVNFFSRYLAAFRFPLSTVSTKSCVCTPCWRRNRILLAGNPWRWSSCFFRQWRAIFWVKLIELAYRDISSTTRLFLSTAAPFFQQNLGNVCLCCKQYKIMFCDHTEPYSRHVLFPVDLWQHFDFR